MNKPTSTALLWWADPSDPLAVWAICSPTTASYTLYWGDGGSTPMAVSSLPIRHAYSKPGRYVPVAFTPSTITADVVVRGERSDTVFAVDDKAHKITATLPPVADPVLYRVDWGDGTVTEHASTDLSPSHTYPRGFDTPIIVVTDVPARWSTRYAVPFPPAPVVVPYTSFGPQGGLWIGKAAIKLRDFPPGITVDMQASSYDTQARDRQTILLDGTAMFNFGMWKQPDADWWRWARFAWIDPESGEPRQLTQHFHTCEWTTDIYGHCACYQNDFAFTLDWDTDHPYVITARSGYITSGTYDVDWGDGHTIQHVVGDDMRLDVTHDYRVNQTAWITISGPPGTARRLVQPLPMTSIENTKDGPVLWWKVQTRGTDSYRPVRIYPDDTRWPPIIETLAPSPDPGYKCGTAWTYREAGTYVCRISAPMTDTFNHTYTQDIYRYDLEQSDHDIPPDPLVFSWKFSVTNVQDTYYEGRFELVNNFQSEWWPGWSIYFDLGPEEVLASAGPYRIVSRGNNQWEIDGDTEISAGGTLAVDIRVDPATAYPVLPRNVRTNPPSLPLS